MTDAFKLDTLINWLIAGAPPDAAFAETVAELGRRMVAAGLAVDTLGVYMLTINPMVLGTLISWSPRRAVRVDRWSHAAMATSDWIGTVPHRAISTGRSVRLAIGTDDPLNAHPATRALQGRGYAEFAAFPLVAKYAPTGAITVGTKQKGGLEEAQVLAIRRIQAPLARLVEAEILHENTVTLLSTYVGRNAGDKVLDGRILRGYSENITAVILFADLRGFTELSNALPAASTIAVLNQFFEAMDSAIRANGGETLKFIGDGLLAIFPTPDDITAQTAAAMGAISALDDARARLGGEQGGSAIAFRAALHLGDIHYGNVGSTTRLDFTAVGPAVNLTARLLQASAEMAAGTVCSQGFAALTPGRAGSAREVALKGFAEPVMVHRID